VAAAQGLRRDYPGLGIDIVRADFETQLGLLPRDGRARLVAFLGGTVGNLEPAPAVTSLPRCGPRCTPVSTSCSAPTW
jgi:L-histidine Nalpha-methyltransferase